MKNVLEGLNKEQKEAVIHEGGPLLIVAGAGTGKTTVITRRIAWLLQEKEVSADEILALTFTDKAAGEMEERVEALLPLGYFDLWISTFHSFGQKILEEHALDIGLPNNFKLLSETEQWLLIRENIDKFELDYYKPKSNPTKFIEALVRHFSRLKDENITPEEYLKYAEDLKQNTDSQELEEGGEVQRVGEVASAYAMYEKILLKNSALDFGDLIGYTIKLFKERPAILKKYQNQFKYLLVDEFQDTNHAQYELIKMLAEPENNLTVVGDDDQSVYKFRGASVSNIMEFKKDFEKCKEVVLVENYRSGQNILDLSHKFIKLNDPDRLEAKMKIDKNLIAKAVKKSEVKYLPFVSSKEEAKSVIEEILNLKKSCSWNDICILIRANAQAEQFIPYLERADVPYQFLASKGLFKKPIIIDLLSFLKLLDNYHESKAVFRVLNFSVFKLKYEDILYLINDAQKRTLSLWEAMLNARTNMKLDAEAIKKIENIISVVEESTRQARENSVGKVLLNFLEKSGYLKEITKIDNQQATEKMLYLNQFYKYIEKFEKGADNKSVQNFIEEINLVLEAGDEGNLKPDFDEGPETVKIMTIHGAKGLEFKYVFIVNLVDKRFPSIKRSDAIMIPEDLIKESLPEGDVHLQEERRLFYVAMTRAKEGLFLTSAENYGGKRKKKPSRFLMETKFVPGLKPKPTGKVVFEVKKSTQPFDTPFDSASPRSGHSGFSNNDSQKFSFTQLKAFETCPWQYRFAHILRIPTKGKPSFSFGKTMHNTLYKFFLKMQEMKGSDQSSLFDSTQSFDTPDAFASQPPGHSGLSNNKGKNSSVPNLDDLMDIYKTEWIAEWYEDKWQEKEYKKKGEDALKKFFEINKDNWPKIKYLEKPMNFKVGEYTIKGVVDRIDDDFSIIDYKTGKFPKIGKKDNEQLYLYALAIKQLLNKTSKKMSFYYIEENKPLEVDFDEKKMKKVEEWTKNLIEEILKGDFKATPGFNCKFCDFREICEFRK